MRIHEYWILIEWFGIPGFNAESIITDNNISFHDLYIFRVNGKRLHFWDERCSMPPRRNSSMWCLQGGFSTVFRRRRDVEGHLLVVKSAKLFNRNSAATWIKIRRRYQASYNFAIPWKSMNENLVDHLEDLHLRVIEILHQNHYIYTSSCNNM